MSLNPSNGIAQRTNPDKKVFPNLARRVSSGDVRGESDEWHRAENDKLRIFKQVDEACQAELEQAGINPIAFEIFRTLPGGCFREVPTKYKGGLTLWTFERAWYYWVATGPGIPPSQATPFHEHWGTQCRVNGHCGCPSPLEANEGFATGEYHIDTQEGLNAFANLLRWVHQPKPTKPTEGVT